MNIKELLEQELQGGDKLSLKQFERIINKVIDMSAKLAVKQLLEDNSHMEQLESIIFERSAELLVCKAFIKEKGLEAELKERLEQAEAKADKASIEGI